MTSADTHSTQSWPSVFVDAMILSTLIFFVYSRTIEPAAWALLSTIVGVRMGTAYGKGVERVARLGQDRLANSDQPPPQSPRV